MHGGQSPQIRTLIQAVFCHGFCAPYRAIETKIETKTLSQVVKLYHSSGVISKEKWYECCTRCDGIYWCIYVSIKCIESFGSSPGKALVVSALDASLVLWSHLAQSPASTLTDFTPLEQLDLHERRQRRANDGDVYLHQSIDFFKV